MLFSVSRHVSAITSPDELLKLKHKGFNRSRNACDRKERNNCRPDCYRRDDIYLPILHTSPHNPFLFQSPSSWQAPDLTTHCVSNQASTATIVTVHCLLTTGIQSRCRRATIGDASGLLNEKVTYASCVELRDEERCSRFIHRPRGRSRRSDHCENACYYAGGEGALEFCWDSRCNHLQA